MCVFVCSRFGYSFCEGHKDNDKDGEEDSSTVVVLSVHRGTKCVLCGSVGGCKPYGLVGVTFATLENRLTGEIE